MLLVSLLLLFLFSAFAVLGADDYRACYYPHGNKALDHVPCSDEEQTACCASDHICMANGLCLDAGSNQPYGFSRAACTDIKWGAGCPQVCVGRESYPAFVIPKINGRNRLTMALMIITQHWIAVAADAQLYRFTPTERTARTAATQLCQMEAVPFVQMTKIPSNSQAVRSSQDAHTSRT
jgi:hypothetical protein